MPHCESPQPIILSNEYYLPRGDLYILIDNTIFHIHRYLITHDSTMINAMLDTAEEDIGKQPTGSSQTDPLFLKSEFTTPHTFTLLLSIIYNPKYNIYENHTWQDWFDILYIAIYWGFGEIEWLAMQQIELIDDRLDSTEQCSNHKKTPLTYQYRAHARFRRRGHRYVCWRISVSFKSSDGAMLWMTLHFSLFPLFPPFVTLSLTLVPVRFPLRLLLPRTFYMTPSMSHSYS